MFHVKKFLMLEILLLLQFLFTQSEFVVEASIGSDNAKMFVNNEEILRERSNDISIKAEEKAKLENDQKLYYLPMQTVFDETVTLASTRGLSTTSPPHLNINPAPIQTEYQESTTLYKDSSTDTYNKDPYQSQCVSETPVIELESRFLLPSKDSVQESVIMSGHLEVASKTSSFDEVSEISNMISKPSIVLQGTVLHSHSISDL